MEIIYTKTCREKFEKDFLRGLFKQSDAKVLELWYWEMHTFGPEFIAKSEEWRDHDLFGKWIGYRSSCFSNSGRIIYRIINRNRIEICEIERITADHNYDR